MAAVVVSVHIPEPPEIVWADVARLDTHVDWMADAESIEFVGDRRNGVGTVMRVLTKVGPFHTTDVIRVTSWVPQQSIGVVHEGVVTGTGEFTLTPINGGTRFVWTEELTLPWYLGGPVGAIVAKPILSAVWRRNLERLAGRFAS